jgi:hypothetical protein
VHRLFQHLVVEYTKRKCTMEDLQKRPGNPVPDAVPDPVPDASNGSSNASSNGNAQWLHTYQHAFRHDWVPDGASGLV